MSILMLIVAVLLHTIEPALSVILMFVASLYYEGKAEYLEGRLRLLELQNHQHRGSKGGSR